MTPDDVEESTDGENGLYQRPTEICVYRGKLCHPSWQSARAALRAHQFIGDVKGKRRDSMNVYHCPACNGWHVGNDDRDTRKIRKKVRKYRERDEDEY